MLLVRNNYAHNVFLLYTTKMSLIFVSNRASEELKIGGYIYHLSS